MDAAEYRHVVLGLIFPSDAFAEHHAKLLAEQATGADPEGPDEYRGRGGPEIGKSTLVRQVTDDAPARVLYANSDEPTLRSADWIQQQWDELDLRQAASNAMNFITTTP